MRARRLIFALVTLVVTLVLVAPKIIESAARHYLPRLQHELPSGTRLSVTELAGHLLGVSARSVDLWFFIKADAGAVSFPVNIQLQDVTISLEPSLSPRLRLQASGYEGSIDLSLRNIRSRPTIHGRIDHINLGTHPQLSALGLSRALVSVTVDGAPVELSPLASARLDLEISDGSFAVSSELFNLIGGETQQVANLLKLDSVTNVAARVVGSMESGVFILRPITLSSSLANVEGQARGTLVTGNDEPSVAGNLRVTLSEQSRHLQNWLPLLSDNTISAESSQFSLRFSSASCSSRSPQVFRLGRLCLRGAAGP